MLAAGLFAVVAASCGSDADGSEPDGSVSAADPATDACLAGDPECVDGEVSAADIEDAARALLGAREDELPDDVRVARRGDEVFGLTEDYVVGRLTVELDDPAGDFVVSSVIAELPGGAAVFSSEAD